jgi:hypothetical protein
MDVLVRTRLAAEPYLYLYPVHVATVLSMLALTRTPSRFKRHRRLIAGWIVPSDSRPHESHHLTTIIVSRNRSQGLAV